MSSAAEHLFETKRAYGTSRERVVLALELIADQLRSLVALLEPPEKADGSVATERANALGEDAWENEGGSLEGLATSLGITHSLTNQFEIGGYRYTQLVDAIAEAKRRRARA